VKDTDTLDHVTEVRRRVKDKIIVSDPTEERWLMNIVHFNQPVLLADPDPYMLQTPAKLYIKEYTELALAGEIEKATELYAKLYRVRRVSEKSINCEGRWELCFRILSSFGIAPWGRI
jgi:4-hydroxy-tetrahydrodipicolinate synthase